MRRGAAWLAEDLDRLEEHLEGFTGQVKVQFAGPWTVAAAVESARGTRVVADAGTCRDLSEALSEALVAYVGGTRRRIPGAEVTVQVDEPMLPLVLAGRLRTPSGRGALRVPATAELSAGLARVESAAREGGATRVVAHCCAREVPFDLLRRSGFQAVSVDVHQLGEGADEALGAWWDQGGEVALGIAPSVGPSVGARPPTAEALARTVTALWGRIGFGVEAVGARTLLTPTCGLAGAAPDWARAVAPLLRGAAGMLESAD
jgi:hypothetical protein